MHIHDHLEVVELLSASQVVDGVYEGLLAHCDDLFAYILDDVLLKSLVFVLVFLFFLLLFLLLVFFIGFASELPEELLVLCVYAVLFFLDCFDDLALGLEIARASVTIAWDLVRSVVTYPLNLGHVDPCLWLRLDFDGWTRSIDVSGTSNVLPRCGCTTVEMLATSEASELFCLRNNNNAALQRQLHGRFHRLAIDHPSCFKLLAHLCAHLVNDLEHALLHQVFAWLAKLNFLI